MHPEARSALQSIVAILTAGVVVVTCTATRERELAGPAGPTPPQLADPIPPSESTPLANVSASSAPAVVAAASASAPSSSGGLGKLRAAFAELAAGTRNEPVRIAWIGDSHTSADLWTGAARRALQTKLGDAGPGFVHVGWSKGYRHDGVKVDAAKWEIVPNQPATGKADDGVLGLGGVRLEAFEPGATASVTLAAGPSEGATPTAAHGKVTWDLAFRLPAGAALRVAVDGGTPIVLKDASVTGVQHRVIPGNFSGGKLEVETLSGRPQLFGVVIERGGPGVVLDTLGVSGARVTTALAWDEKAWIAELTRRAPDAVVIAYGTNESEDPAPTQERYQKRMDSLLVRMRAAVPKADCVIITPMDRSKVEAERRLPILARAYASAGAAHGCVTWSAFDAMGGNGSMSAWISESPPRAQKDGVHLSAKGYAFLGDKVASFLMEGR